MKTLVLERREIMGGAAITQGLHPGFHCSTLAHSVGPLLPQVLKELQLTRHGLELIEPPVRATALHPEGRAISIYADTAKTVKELERLSAHDAAQYPEFVACIKRLGRVL